MLKYFIAFSFIFTCFILPAQRNIDVLHYKFNIELNDNNDTIYGKAEITIRFLQPSAYVEFDLAQNKDSKGMKVLKATDDKVREVLNNSNSKITLFLSKTNKANDTATFIIFYKGIPADGLIISKNQYGHRTFFSDNWPNRAHYWIPCIDDPSDKASVEFIVTAPSHYEVVANGILIGESNLPGDRKLTHWKEDVPLPTKVMVIGVADFAVDNVDTVSGIPVSSWVFPEKKKEGFYDYALAKDILAYFINYIGPFPYKKLANVQSKTMFGGMENASAIFYYENSVTGERLEESLFAHEIVHQWFGDMATEKSFAHLWLSEGFATYLTRVYIESKYGTDSLNYEMKKDRDVIIEYAKESDRPVVDSVSPLMKLLNANSYQKGGWVLHMLRRQLGDLAFHKIIRSYYTTYAGKNAETKDFQKICEDESGKDLKSFFDQWLFSPGVPKLDMQWRYDSKNKMVLLKIKQLQEKPFSFPLDIQVKTSSGKSVSQTFSITKKSQEFKIAVKEKTSRVILDPNTALLFDGSVSTMRK